MNSELLGGFGNFPGFDAARANAHPLSATLWKLYTNFLQIWIKTPGRSIVCVRNIVSELWPFTTDFATFGHSSYKTS
jgi:hypothetical protein